MWSEEIMFFFEHQDEVAAIVGINDYARTEIVERTRASLKAAIDQSAKSSKWSGMPDLRSFNEKDRVWWSASRLYSFNKQVGIYFQLEYLNAGTLIDGPDEPMLDLAFYVDPNMRNRDWSQAIQVTTSAVAQVCAMMKDDAHLILGGEQALRDGYAGFVHQPLGQPLNLSTVRELDSAIDKVVVQARAFTQRFAENLPDVAQMIPA